MKTTIAEIVDFLDYKRIPVSAKERETRHGKYPYYGAQGIVDNIDDYIFDGEYLLVAEDGENLRSKNQDIAQMVNGQFWVNNHAHILADNGNANLKYVCYLLNTLAIDKYITGSAQPKLSQASLSSIVVDIADRDTQDKIVKVIDSLDRKISLNRKANELLESMAKQLYDYWFVQFDFPNEEGKPYKSSGGRMVYNEKLKRDIPEGWEVKQLAELTKDEMESICPCDTPDVMFKHYSIPAFDDCASYALEKGDTILSNKFVPTENDILVSKLNPWTSRVIWCTDEENAICSTEFVSLAPDNHEEKGFFYMLAKSKPFIIYCTKASTGTSHSHRRVNPEIMKMFIFPYQKDIISAYSKIVSNYIEKSVKHIHENKKLQSLRDYLLPLLMNGQVKVS